MRLRLGIARDGFIDLPRWSAGWQPSEESYYESVAEAKFQAVQGGDRCCMQVALGRDGAASHLLPFRELWTRTLLRVLEQRREEIWFVPELLGTTYEYARVFKGEEKGDRWQDALLLQDVARDCLKAAMLR